MSKLVSIRFARFATAFCVRSVVVAAEFRKAASDNCNKMPTGCGVYPA